MPTNTILHPPQKTNNFSSLKQRTIQCYHYDTSEQSSQFHHLRKTMSRESSAGSIPVASNLLFPKGGNNHHLINPPARSTKEVPIPEISLMTTKTRHRWRIITKKH